MLGKTKTCSLPSIVMGAKRKQVVHGFQVSWNYRVLELGGRWIGIPVLPPKMKGVPDSVEKMLMSDSSSVYGHMGCNVSNIIGGIVIKSGDDLRNANRYEVMMTRGERRATKRFKERYGHHGAGASHTREASDAEVIRHVQKARGSGKKS